MNIDTHKPTLMLLLVGIKQRGDVTIFNAGDNVGYGLGNGSRRGRQVKYSAREVTANGYQSSSLSRIPCLLVVTGRNGCRSCACSDHIGAPILRASMDCFNCLNFSICLQPHMPMMQPCNKQS